MAGGNGRTCESGCDAIGRNEKRCARDGNLRKRLVTRVLVTADCTTGAMTRVKASGGICQRIAPILTVSQHYKPGRMCLQLCVSSGALWTRRQLATILLLGAITLASSLDLPSSSSLLLSTLPTSISSLDRTSQRDTPTAQTQSPAETQTHPAVSDKTQVSTSSVESSRHQELPPSDSASTSTGISGAALSSTISNLPPQTTTSTPQLPTTQTYASLSAGSLSFTANQTTLSNTKITSSQSPSSHLLVEPATFTNSKPPVSTISSLPDSRKKSGGNSTNPSHGVIVALITFGFLAGSIILIFVWNKWKARNRSRTVDHVRFSDRDNGYNEFSNETSFMGARVSRLYNARCRDGHQSTSSPFTPGNRPPTRRGATSSTMFDTLGPSIVVSAPSIPKLPKNPQVTSGSEQSSTFPNFARNSLGDGRAFSDASAYSDAAYPDWRGQQDEKTGWSMQHY